MCTVSWRPGAGRPGSGARDPEVSGPTLAELADLAERLASMWSHRAAPALGPVVVRRDETVEVIVRRLVPAPFAGWHGHGPARGAVHVLRGTVVEWWWSDGADDPSELAPEEVIASGPGPRRRELRQGTTGFFPGGRLHDLGCRTSDGAVVLEVWSPPGEPVTSYELDRGVLYPQEPAAPAQVA